MEAPLTVGAGPTALLALANLSKTFGGVRALDAVALSLEPGEIHGLLGANGSGKSTLVKILAGVHAPDPGAQLTLKGREVRLPLPPGAFRRLGLSFVHQDLGLIPALSVLENLRSSAILSSKAFRVDWRAERRLAGETIARLELGLDLDQRVAELSPADRALLAIARAFEELKAGGGQGVMVLDEPTPFLPKAAVERLFSLMRGIVAGGSSVIFISHDVDEILEITDQVTVLRDGRVAGTRSTAGAGRDDVVALILGRKIESAPLAPPGVSRRSAPRLRLTGVVGGALKGVDLEVAPGEIVGLTGLIGSGYEDLTAFAFGARRASAGVMQVDGGKDLDLRGMAPRDAMARGVAFVPADRPSAGVVGRLSVTDNMMLPSLSAYFVGGRLRRRRMTERARELGQRFDVRPNDPDQVLAALSGGNAQKVVIARWLGRAPRLFLLDEPTQGVDVGARGQILAALREQAQEGLCVVVSSSDYEQLAIICDRVLVFRRGAVHRTLNAPGLTKEAIAAACYLEGESSEG